MKSKRRATLLTLVLIVGLLLVACQSTQESVTTPEPAGDQGEIEEQEATVEPTDEPAPEPTEEPPPTETPLPEPTATPEPVAAGPEQLDVAFTTFLEDMNHYNIIGLEEANVALVEGSPPFLLDVRQVEEVEEKGHIEGAVLIPLRELGQQLELLPSFDAPIIAYCGSGWRATIAAASLEALGWQDVKVLKGGSFGGWVEAGYPTVDGLPPDAETLSAATPDPSMVFTIDAMLQSIPEGWGTIKVDALNSEVIENEDLVLIDVRTEAEMAEKGLIDAPSEPILIPIETFIAQRDQWPAEKGTPIVVYCGSGHRSTIGMTILRAYGYEDVRSLVGGFSAWAEAGFATVGGEPDLDGAFATFLADMNAYNTIGLEDANVALLEDPPPYLLDVREISEVEENGHIEGANLIPLRQLAQNISVLPAQDVPIIVYCAGGWRATIAMTALEAMGWEDVKALKGGSFGGWVEAGYPVIEGLPPDPLMLEVAAPDPAMVAAIDSTLQAVPEGWGTVRADGLNTELIENPDLVLIDVRRQEEVAEKGIIEADNLTHIPLEEFVEAQDQWPSELGTPIVIYCGSGHRSTIAMTILYSYGYSDVRSLVGGFSAWAEAGYPVVEYAAP